MKCGVAFSPPLGTAEVAAADGDIAGFEEEVVVVVERDRQMWST